MSTDEAMKPLTEVIRWKLLALATERVYCAYLKGFPFHLPSQQKLRWFLRLWLGRMPPQELKIKPLTRLFFET